MKRVVVSSGTIEVREVAVPDLRRGEVLIDTAFSAISAGTEMWLIAGSRDPEFANHEYPADPPSWPKIRNGIAHDHPLPRPPSKEFISLGYSLAGRVLAVHDDIVDLRPGDLVAASGSQCAVHAEVVAVPRNLVAPVPDGVPLHDAALVTLGSIAVCALRAANSQFGETIVLYGMGLLGLLAGQIGVAAGYRVIGVDIDDRQLRLAQRMGVHDVLNPNDDDVTAAVRDLTDGFGADAVVLGVKTDSSEPLNQSFDMCRQGGTVVAQGLFGGEISRARFLANRVTLVPAVGYGLGRYDPVYEEGNVDFPIGLGRWTENRNQQYFLDLLRRGSVTTELLAPDQVHVSRAPDAYELLSRPDRPPTVVLRYGGDE